MSREESNGFTTREMLRELINKTELNGNRLTAIETKIDAGSKTMEDHSKDIKTLSSWMNGVKAAVGIVGSSVGIHFFKNGGL